MKKVVLYTQPDCPPCDIMKQYFAAEQIAYEERNVKTDETARKQLTVKWQSLSTPTVVIDDEYVVRGFDLPLFEHYFHRDVEQDETEAEDVRP